MRLTTKIINVLTICQFTIYSLSSIQAQPITQEWVKTVNGFNPNNPDAGLKIVMDTIGNSYATGYISTIAGDRDYLTIKYNATGTQLWTATYNGTGNLEDTPRDMVLDNIGNVYVTGLSFGNGTLEDFVTVKYDVNGIEQWVKRYNGSANGTDFAAAITLSPAGYLYVTGRSRDNSTGDDYVTIKYDLSGNVIWTNKYNYAAQNGNEQPADIIVDQNENVYITGRSIGTSGLDDYLTIKLDSLGNELWNKRYNGPSDDLDLATHIVLDNMQNPIITGYSSQSGQSFDIVTIKYDTSGNQMFLNRFNGGVGMDVPNGMVIDNANNIYITGYSFQGTTGSNFTTLKYNPSLVLQWSQFYDGTASPGVDDNDRARSICLDSFGNVYVTGSANNTTTDHDVTTIKYNPAGIQQWIQTYSGTNNGTDLGRALVVNSLNEVYVVGESTETGTNTDFITIKYSQTLSFAENLFPEKNITIYPNPSDGKFTINTEFNKAYTITIIDAQGKIIFEKAANEKTIPINISKTVPGIYLVKFQKENLIITKKIIYQ